MGFGGQRPPNLMTVWWLLDKLRSATAIPAGEYLGREVQGIEGRGLNRNLIRVQFSNEKALYF